MAAFFSACFLVLAGSPAKLMPASSTVEENTGEWPGPERTVVYAGSFSPARWAVSCSRFLYTPVSSYAMARFHFHVKLGASAAAESQKQSAREDGGEW
jgi:hypothetical protein